MKDIPSHGKQSVGLINWWHNVWTKIYAFALNINITDNFQIAYGCNFEGKEL